MCTVSQIEEAAAPVMVYVVNAVQQELPRVTRDGKKEYSQRISPPQEELVQLVINTSEVAFSLRVWNSVRATQTFNPLNTPHTNLRILT